MFAARQRNAPAKAGSHEGKFSYVLETFAVLAIKHTLDSRNCPNIYRRVKHLFRIIVKTAVKLNFPNILDNFYDLISSRQGVLLSRRQALQNSWRDEIDQVVWQVD